MTATNFSNWARENLERFAREAAAQLAERSADTKMIDWLADPHNHVGNVQLPRECVEPNIHSLRAALADAMRRHPLKKPAA